jgi:S-adenosylmethionine:tRNA ribosyltransferase-isomerase
VIAARGPRVGARLLVIDPIAGAWRDGDIGDLPGLLAPGDLLVLNDAATLPASLTGVDAAGCAVEIRLLDGADLDRGEASVVIFGAGDWRTPTEHRPAPPTLAVGAALSFGRGAASPAVPSLVATVVGLDPRSPRLLTLRFDRAGAALLDALYAMGRPVQYSYLGGDVSLGAVQTPFATRPWSMEMPSAARALGTGLLTAVRRHGVRLATLTHAAGLSATGDDALDALLPLPERYEIPAATVDAIHTTHRAGGRVIAVGTTVARALEGAARKPGGLAPGPGATDLVLDARTPLHVVDALLSGMHGPGESHFRVLAALAPVALLEGATVHATRRGYLAHEFGDATLVLPGALAPERAAG